MAKPYEMPNILYFCILFIVMLIVILTVKQYKVERRKEKNYCCDQIKERQKSEILLKQQQHENLKNILLGRSRDKSSIVPLPVSDPDE